MNKKINNKAVGISKQAMIAAIYTVLSVALSAISFGSVQIRISEALTLLPVFCLNNIWGVTIGCFLTNLIGFFTGANILGGLDMIFGTLATLTAAVTTYAFRKIKFRNIPVLSIIPPIVYNAVVIGWELCMLINNGNFSPIIFWAQAISVGVGQLLSCGVIGVFMLKTIEKNTTLKEYLSR